MTTLPYPHQRAAFHSARSLLSLHHSIITAAPRSYAHDDKWCIMQGASGGHRTVAASAALSRGAGAVDAVGADET